MAKGYLTNISRMIFNVRIWSRKVKLASKAAYGLGIGAIVSVIVTLATFSNVGPFAPTPTTLYVLLLLDLALLLFLAALVARQVVQVWSAQKSGAAGSRLHRKIVTLFSVVAITPTIIVAVISGMFFELGLQSWFSDKVQTALNNSQNVAEAYIVEHRNSIRADILAMAKEINNQAFLYSKNTALLEQTVSFQSQALSLSEAIIFNRMGTVQARARTTLPLFGDPFPQDALDQAAKGGVIPLGRKSGDDRVRALVKLDGFLDLYLYISRFVDPEALALVNATQEALSDYNRAFSEQSQYRLWFNLTFIAIALLILLFAVWLGLGLATKLMRPVGILIEASEKVGKGDFSARAPIEKAYDDLGGLPRAFNKMILQLDRQQKDILEVNLKLEERRRFTEAVLSGVSAGIMGLDPKGKITLPNRSALTLLGLDMTMMLDKNIREVMPEAAELFDKIRDTNADFIQDQIVINRDDINLNLMVRITVEQKEGMVEGFVITFDDITEQVAAQRTAAWADVARRIAHEIKNPLTPIQLAAERLKRKYLKEIQTDPKVFSQCTDTIIRQVGDLRHMVDEFSSFARMPAPIIKSENLTEITKQAFFMMEVANSDIDFQMDFPDRPLIIECDSSQIGQALTNLIKNAAESIGSIAANAPAEKSGKIRISLEETEDTILISVVDNGNGLPEKLMDRLTEPYVTTRAKGTGLGLAIVKKIMMDHGGDLRLTNNSGAGASVTMIFHKGVNALKRDESEDRNLRMAHGS